MDIERLLEAADRGERWAGPALVTLLMPMLLRYAKEVGGDLTPADQEEAVEKAVLRSVERIDRYDRQRATFPSWVRGFVRYALADVRRKKAGFSERSVGEVPEPDDRHSESEISEEESMSPSLTWSLLELSVTDQIIIALRDFEGLSYEQCASRIGDVSVSACRVRHFRALRRLQELLRNDPDYEHLFEEGNDTDD